MLSGSVQSPEWAVLDLNSESSAEWAKEIQTSVNYTGSNLSDGRYIKPDVIVPWGGGTIYHFIDSSSTADHGLCSIGTDIDFRNRYITVLDAWAQDFATKMPLTSGSYTAVGTYESNPTLPWDFGRKTFWAGTGSNDGAPPTNGTYLTWYKHEDAVAPTAYGYLFVNRATGLGNLVFRNETGLALYYGFVILVSDQTPYRI
jgi:hypothetical protein